VLAGCKPIDSYLEKVPYIGEKLIGQDQENDGQAPEKNEADGEGEKSPQHPAGKPASEDGELVLEASYFNVIQQQDGRNVIQNPQNILSLVNKIFGLPAN